MKKIFTILLLAMLICIPRSMQAVVWKVSDGTQLRINPATKAPHDLVTIPAGTKYMEICGPFDYYFPGVGYHYEEAREYHGDYNAPFYFYNSTFANFASSALRGRILRALGYPSLEELRDAGNNAYKYAILTEEEVLAVKKLDLNPRSYGLVSFRWDSSGHRISNFSGLEVFRNLEELDISNAAYNIEDDIFGYRTHMSENTRLWQQEEAKKAGDSTYFVPDFTKSSVEEFVARYGRGVLYDLSEAREDALYHYTLLIRCFPHLKKLNLSHLYEQHDNTYLAANYFLDLRGNNTLEELDVSGSAIRILDLEGCTKLRKLKTTSPQEYSVDYKPLYQGIQTIFMDNVTTLELDDETFAAENLATLKARNCGLKILDLSRCPNLRQLYCNDNLLESITFNSQATLLHVECQRNNLTSLTVPAFTSSLYLSPYPSYNYDEEGMGYLDCSENTLMSLNIKGGLGQLFCWNNNLSELDVTSCPKLWRLGMSNNRVSSLNLSKNEELKVLYCNNNRLTSLDCSGLEYLEELQASQNRLTELDMSNCSALTTLYCDAQGGYNGRLLRKLDLTGCTSLTTLHCQNNALLSLNLSDCPNLSASKVKGYTQRATEDVTVLDGDKVCIELVNGVTSGIANTYNSLFDLESDNLYVTWGNSGFEKERNRVVKKDGKTYLVIHDISDDARGGAQKKADVDFYGKKLHYQYVLRNNNFNETLGGSAANGKKADNITVTVYPYVMYINPATEDLFTTPATPFYSGTIYLDYDAVVPEGTEVYVATGMQLDKTDMISGGENTTSGQLNLVKLTPAEGATHVVIPALTPVYVKSPDETGLFSFARNLDNEPLASVPAGNIFKGTLTDKTVEPLSVLTLSKGRKTTESGYTSESRVGFWRYTKTTVPAHRVYIDASELENLGGRDARGMTFNFFDSEAEMLTAIEGLNAGSQQQPTLNNAGWYTPSGLRLNGQPTEKGVYIRNGKKVIK